MTIDLQRSLAILTSKALTRTIRLAGRGGGTAFPGVVATRIDSRLLDKMAGQFSSGTVIVAGTNGKTTTSRMLAGTFERQGLSVLHNRAGSNLVRGISAAFAEKMPVLGDGHLDIGVIESDENAFPDVVRRVRPRMVILLNLFRDQLDRYGELEAIAELWRPAVAALDPTTILVVNADDPNLAALADESPARVVRFGFHTPGYRLPELPHAADAATCRRCGTRLDYDAIYISHLGAYRCPGCGYQRPDLDFSVVDARTEQIDRQWVTIADRGTGDEFELELSLPGVYNAYNALAAVAASRAFGIDRAVIGEALRSFVPAFGRMEQIDYRGLHLTLTLAKNPVGFNEILRMLASSNPGNVLVIGINDLDADGRDVSWLWDVDFEVLAGDAFAGDVVAAGIRGPDMAVRMKYAGLPADRIDSTVAGRPFADLLDHLVDRCRPGESVFLLLTYTAMLELRSALAGRGAVQNFWEQ